MLFKQEETIHLLGELSRVEEELALNQTFPTRTIELLMGLATGQI